MSVVLVAISKQSCPIGRAQRSKDAVCSGVVECALFLGYWTCQKVVRSDFLLSISGVANTLLV